MLELSMTFIFYNLGPDFYYKAGLCKIFIEAYLCLSPRCKTSIDSLSNGYYIFRKGVVYL